MTEPSVIRDAANFASEVAIVDGVRLHYLVGGNPAGPPVLLWHGFLGTHRVWRRVLPALAEAGLAVLVPDMRGYGDSDKPDGTAGYDARSLAEDFRGLVRTIGFGGRRPLVLVGHDMGAPPALLWAADHPDEVAGLVYVEAPVMLSEVISGILAYAPETMEEGSMWWWILPLAPDVPERLVVGHERPFLTWFYERATASRDAISEADVAETLRTFSGREGVLGAMGVYRAAFTTMDQTRPPRGRLVAGRHRADARGGGRESDHRGPGQHGDPQPEDPRHRGADRGCRHYRRGRARSSAFIPHAGRLQRALDQPTPLQQRRAAGGVRRVQPRRGARHAARGGHRGRSARDDLRTRTGSSSGNGRPTRKGSSSSRARATTICPTSPGTSTGRSSDSTHSSPNTWPAPGPG